MLETELEKTIKSAIHTLPDECRTASNLFTINNGYKGYDPETGVTSGAMYPVMKTFNFGINLDF